MAALVSPCRSELVDGDIGSSQRRRNLRRQAVQFNTPGKQNTMGIDVRRFLAGRLVSCIAMTIAVAVLAACGGGSSDNAAASSQAAAKSSQPFGTDPILVTDSVPMRALAASAQLATASPTFTAADLRASFPKLRQFAEQAVPILLPPGGASVAWEVGPLIVVHYPATDNYLALALETSGTWVQGHVYGAGPSIVPLPGVYDAGPITAYVTVTPVAAPVTVLAQIWAGVWELKAKPFAATWYPYLVTVYSDYSYDAKSAVNNTGWTVGVSPLGGCTFHRAESTPAATLNVACQEAKGSTYQYFTWTKSNNPKSCS